MINNRLIKKFNPAHAECSLKANVSNALKLGSKAEEFVASHLEKQGFRLLHQNYKKSFGEIDIVALKKDLLIFVEVKMRSRCYFDAAELITTAKQKRVINTAHMYIAQFKHSNKMCRFDVALVELKNNIPCLTYIPNAFGES